MAPVTWLFLWQGSAVIVCITALPMVENFWHTSWYDQGLCQSDGGALAAEQAAYAACPLRGLLTPDNFVGRCFHQDAVSSATAMGQSVPDWL